MKSSENEWIGGVRAVVAALDASPERVLELCLARKAGDRVANEATRAARRAGVKVRRVHKSELDGHLPGVNHQGVAVRRGLVGYVDLDRLARKGQTPLTLVALDGVTDPRNVGAILRSAWAFEVGGVLLPRHRAAGLTAAAVKTAAGAAEHVLVCRVANTTRALEHLKGLGYWIFGADGEADTTLSELDFSSPTVIVLGAEGKGIRPAVRSVCDALYRIPMASAAGSLNVSVAAGISLAAVYEWRRCR